MAKPCKIMKNPIENLRRAVALFKIYSYVCVSFKNQLIAIYIPSPKTLAAISFLSGLRSPLFMFIGKWVERFNHAWLGAVP